MLQQLGNLPASPATTDFLMEEMLHGPQLQARVAAADALRKRGKPEAVTAMISELEKSTLQGPEDGGVLTQLCDFLAGCDSVEAIEALGHNLRQRPAETKSHFVASVGNTNRPSSQTQGPATIEAIERFLIAALEDTDEYHSLEGAQYGVIFPARRICDLAALFLSERWPSRYIVSLPGDLEALERRRIEFLNTWRAAHHLPTLPLSQP
jgi:hypothetical protein